MTKVSIPPVRLPWREKDIKSGDPNLLAAYLKLLVKTLQKRLEEIGNAINEGLPCSKQQNGYLKLPNGLIVQWGKVTVNITNNTPDPYVESDIQVNFPISFPNAVFSITITRDNYNTGNIYVTDFALKNINKNSFYFDFYVNNVLETGTVNWFWMAIGH